MFFQRDSQLVGCFLRQPVRWHSGEGLNPSRVNCNQESFLSGLLPTISRPEDCGIICWHRRKEYSEQAVVSPSVPSSVRMPAERTRHVDRCASVLLASRGSISQYSL
jgi:hypothetical protein